MANTTYNPAKDANRVRPHLTKEMDQWFTGPVRQFGSSYLNRMYSTGVAQSAFHFSDYFSRNLMNTIESKLIDKKNEFESLMTGLHGSDVHLFTPAKWDEFKMYIAAAVKNASNKYRNKYEDVCISELAATIFFMPRVRSSYDHTPYDPERNYAWFVPWTIANCDTLTCEKSAAMSVRSPYVAAALWVLDELKQNNADESLLSELRGLNTNLTDIVKEPSKYVSNETLAEQFQMDEVHSTADVLTMAHMLSDMSTIKSIGDVMDFAELYKNNELYEEAVENIKERWDILCELIGQVEIDSAVAYVHETVDKFFDYSLKFIASLALNCISSGCTMNPSNVMTIIQKAVLYLPDLIYKDRSFVEWIIGYSNATALYPRFVIEDPYRFLFGMVWMDIHDKLPVGLSGPYLQAYTLALYELPWMHPHCTSIMDFNMVEQPADNTAVRQFDVVAIVESCDNRAVNYAQMVCALSGVVPARRQNMTSAEFMDRWHIDSDQLTNSMFETSETLKNAVSEAMAKYNQNRLFDNTIIQVANADSASRKLSYALCKLNPSVVNGAGTDDNLDADGWSFILNLENAIDAVEEYEDDTPKTETVKTEDNNKNEESSESVVDHESELSKQLNDATEDLRVLRAKLKSIQSELSEAKTAVKTMTGELERRQKDFENARNELTDLRTIVFNSGVEADSNDTDGDNVISEDGNTIEFPYRTEKKIIVFGGHDTWRNNMKELFPDVRFISREMVPREELIRGAEEIWIQTNAISHAFSGKIVDVSRINSIPVRYFTASGWKQCAKQFVNAHAN